MSALRALLALSFPLLMMPIVWAGAPAGLATMEVYSDSNFPITDLEEVQRQIGIRISVYDLSAPRKLEDALSAGLPNTEAAATATMRQRLEVELPALQRQFRHAYEGYTQALNTQIEKYPAVVFDGTVVIYGVTDLMDALNRYRRWKEVKAP